VLDSEFEGECGERHGSKGTEVQVGAGAPVGAITCCIQSDAVRGGGGWDVRGGSFLRKVRWD